MHYVVVKLYVQPAGAPAPCHIKVYCTGINFMIYLFPNLLNCKNINIYLNYSVNIKSSLHKDRV